MREHKMTEGILKDQRGIYMAVKGSLGFSSQNKKNTIEFIKQKGKFKAKGKKKKSKGHDKCFLCGKKMSLEEEGMSLVLEEIVNYASFSYS